MKLRRRRIFNIIAVVPLLLAFALAAIWIASYWYAGLIQHEFLRDTETAIHTRQVWVEIAWGSLLIDERAGTMTRPVVVIRSDGSPRGERSHARRVMLEKLQWQEQRTFLARQVQADNGARRTFELLRITSRMTPRPGTSWRAFSREYTSAPDGKSYHQKIRLPIWALSLGLLLMALLLRAIRGPIYAAGLCAVCGYSLTGNTSGVCPECGVSIAARTNP